MIPQWAEVALAKRLEEPEHGFHSYGEVQQWLAETLGVEAEYHAVYQMTRYRLKAKLKAPRPEHIKQNPQQREAFKKPSRRPCLVEPILSSSASRRARHSLLYSRRESVWTENLDWTIDYGVWHQTDWSLAVVVQSLLALRCG